MRLPALAAVLALVACGSDPCGPSPCKNDPMRTSSEVDQCHKTIDANRNATCFSEGQRLNGCANANTVCTSGQTTDFQLSVTKGINNCSREIDAYNSCCAGNTSSTACP